jgi:hypothetical protein
MYSLSKRNQKGWNQEGSTHMSYDLLIDVMYLDETLVAQHVIDSFDNPTLIPDEDDLLKVDTIDWSSESTVPTSKSALEFMLKSYLDNGHVEDRVNVLDLRSMGTGDAFRIDGKLFFVVANGFVDSEGNEINDSVLAPAAAQH